MATQLWTEADIVDQTGRTFVVTGANSGLGLESTKALTAAGARVIMACRNIEKAEAVREELPADSRRLV
ncbi:SDR family NAD(P)-dependent oxidoreductase, partial [Dietzia sp.]|uniref:SDR family NAD(P)-dependent oxidoreductase n=1 Tax=Dietzia sp. TaxID=1871616 RepID=UPI002FD99238